jgi:uncharacterized RDD family membrane protein YckC
MNPPSALDIDRLARRRAASQLGWFTHAAAYVAVNLGLASLALGATHRHWPIYPALGWGLGLLAHGVAVWGTGHGSALRERLAARERARLHRQWHDSRPGPEPR